MDVTCCDGPLVWFDAAPGHGETPSAIVECCCCGYFAVFGAPLDERHRETPVLSD